MKLRILAPSAEIAEAFKNKKGTSSFTAKSWAHVPPVPPSFDSYVCVWLQSQRIAPPRHNILNQVRLEEMESAQVL